MHENYAKRKVAIILSIVMMVTLLPTASSYALTSISDKSVYKITKYVSGDCDLCSNAYMLRRMAILLGTDKYKNITNTSMRGIASFDREGDGCCNDVYYSYSFTSSGIKYSVKSANLPATQSGNVSKIKSLLKTNPAGIVVWGPNAGSANGSITAHAVLVVGYDTNKKTFKVADSANNYNGLNKGITTWSGSIMRSIKYCTKYWYISSTTLAKQSAPTVSKYNSTKVKVAWKDVYGQNRYQVSKSTSSTGTNIEKTIKTTVSGSTTLTSTKNKKYYYKTRPYNYFTYKDWAGTSHEKTVYGPWSNTTAYTLK